VDFENISVTGTSVDATTDSILNSLDQNAGKQLALLAYSVGAYVACEIVLQAHRRGRLIGALMLIDPAFQNDQVPHDLAERVMASSLMDDIPDELDAPRFKTALIDLFPSYAARFTATSAIDLSGNTLPIAETQSLVVPTLLLISTDVHPVFTPVAGGPPAREEWKRRLPHGLVVHVKSTHLSVPYTAETGWSILNFLACVSGLPFRLNALLAGLAKFEEIERVMENARRSFRSSWAEKHATTDFRRVPVAFSSLDGGSRSGGSTCNDESGSRRTFTCASAPTVCGELRVSLSEMCSPNFAFAAQRYDDVMLLVISEREKLFGIALKDLCVFDAHNFVVRCLHVHKCLM